ncbi:MAG: RNA pyrophosphohydrolase [Rickettsiales bacterium]
MNKSSSLPYRPGVGMMLYNPQKKIFVAKRLDMRAEAWQMPQGGIDKDEEPRAAAIRELEEEIGTKKATIIAESKDWYTYDLPPDLVPKVWGGKFRGQRQKWYLMRFDGTDDDINIETEHPEFLEYKWIEPAELPAVIVPFKRTLYEQLVAEFSRYF